MNIETPHVFVCMGYDQVFDDYNTVDIQALVRGIPSIKAMEFIIERMNKVIYAFSDVETQLGFIYEAMCYLGDTARGKMMSFISRHDKAYFMDNQSCFLFFMLILQNYNEDRKDLNVQDINNIYKAYLYCSQYWTDKQQANENDSFSSIIEASIRIDLPIVEFKLYKDFKPQIYKASRFFHFCETNRKFKEFSELFFAEKGIPNYVEYISRLFSFYHSSFNSIYITITSEFNSQIAFFDQFIINQGDCDDLWNTENLNYLRNHFLLKTSDDTYLVLNINLLVDKFYQGLIFDFWNIVEKNKGTNSKGTLIKDFGEFKSLLGDDFSENILLYDLIEKSFISTEYKKLQGKFLKSQGVKQEPDYYIRKENTIFLFEYKDLIISDDVKQSDDYEYIKSEILRRICKDGDSNRKGGAQLLYNIDRILNQQLLDKLDQPINNNTIVYPIIVINDRAFNALGINFLLLEEFVNISKNKYPHLQGKVKIPVIVDIDTLFLLMTRLKSGSIDFQALLDSYCKVFENPQTCMMPLNTFIIDYFPKEKFTQEELSYMLDGILNIVKVMDNEDQ